MDKACPTFHLWATDENTPNYTWKMETHPSAPTGKQCPLFESKITSIQFQIRARFWEPSLKNIKQLLEFREKPPNLPSCVGLWSQAERGGRKCQFLFLIPPWQILPVHYSMKSCGILARGQCPGPSLPDQVLPSFLSLFHGRRQPGHHSLTVLTGPLCSPMVHTYLHTLCTRPLSLGAVGHKQT
jgi:hypothetical protein